MIIFQKIIRNIANDAMLHLQLILFEELLTPDAAPRSAPEFA